MAQVKSDGVPTAIRTVNCAKTFHVERLLGSLPVSWVLSWPHGSEVLDKAAARSSAWAHGEGAQKLSP